MYNLFKSHNTLILWLEVSREARHNDQTEYNEYLLRRQHQDRKSESRSVICKFPGTTKHTNYFYN